MKEAASGEHRARVLKKTFGSRGLVRRRILLMRLLCLFLAIVATDAVQVRVGDTLRLRFTLQNADLFAF